VRKDASLSESVSVDVSSVGHDFQAVILAAGMSRRMRPLSENCHKGLLTVGGATILGRIMDNLRRIGVERVTVVTGYLAEDLEEFLHLTFSDLDVRLVNNPDFDSSNNVVSLSLALESMTFDRDVILIECDLLFDRTMLQRLLQHENGNVALVDRYDTGMDGTVVAARDGIITHWYMKETQGADFSFADKLKTLNIYRLDREFCRDTLKPLIDAYAHDIDASCFYELVFGELTKSGVSRMGAEIVDGERWAEVDDPSDVAKASVLFRE
jgi:choline kinase